MLFDRFFHSFSPKWDYFLKIYSYNSQCFFFSSKTNFHCLYRSENRLNKNRLHPLLEIPNDNKSPKIVKNKLFSLSWKRIVPIQFFLEEINSSLIFSLISFKNIKYNIIALTKKNGINETKIKKITFSKLIPKMPNLIIIRKSFSLEIFNRKIQFIINRYYPYPFFKTIPCLSFSNMHKILGFFWNILVLKTHKNLHFLSLTKFSQKFPGGNFQSFFSAIFFGRTNFLLDICQIDKECYFVFASNSQFFITRFINSKKCWKKKMIKISLQALPENGGVFLLKWVDKLSKRVLTLSNTGSFIIWNIFLCPIVKFKHKFEVIKGIERSPNYHFFIIVSKKICMHKKKGPKTRQKTMLSILLINRTKKIESCNRKSSNWFTFIPKSSVYSKLEYKTKKYSFEGGARIPLKPYISSDLYYLGGFEKLVSNFWRIHTSSFFFPIKYTDSFKLFGSFFDFYDSSIFDLFFVLLANFRYITRNEIRIHLKEKPKGTFHTIYCYCYVCKRLMKTRNNKKKSFIFCKRGHLILSDYYLKRNKETFFFGFYEKDFLHTKKFQSKISNYHGFQKHFSMEMNFIFYFFDNFHGFKLA